MNIKSVLSLMVALLLIIVPFTVSAETVSVGTLQEEVAAIDVSIASEEEIDSLFFKIEERKNEIDNFNLVVSSVLGAKTPFYKEYMDSSGKISGAFIIAVGGLYGEEDLEKRTHSDKVFAEWSPLSSPEGKEEIRKTVNEILRNENPSATEEALRMTFEEIERNTLARDQKSENAMGYHIFELTQLHDFSIDMQDELDSTEKDLSKKISVEEFNRFMAWIFITIVIIILSAVLISSTKSDKEGFISVGLIVLMLIFSYLSGFSVFSGIVSGCLLIAAYLFFKIKYRYYY